MWIYTDGDFAYKLRIEAYRTKQSAMFPFDPPAIAATETQQKADDHVTPDDIQLPLTWITGGLLATLLLGFTIIWWVSRLKFSLEEAQKRLDNYEKQVMCVQSQEQNQRIELRDGLRADLRRDIAESALKITSKLELFALEIRQNIRSLSEKLEGRDATVNRQGQKIEHIHNEMIGMAKQLQNQNIAIHYRRGDNGPPSNPHNYDED